MAKTPKYARYNWVPVSVTVGLSAAALIAMQMTGGNHNGASHTPGVDTMPYYPVIYPVGNPENAEVPAKAEKVAAWVCRGFVFVDSEHNEVIVNPIVDNQSQQPLHYIGATAAGIEFGKPEEHTHTMLYRYVDGKLIQDEDGRLNRCYGADPVAAANVHDEQGNGNRYVLTDPASTVHAGDSVATDPETAMRDGLVHADYDMDFSDVHALVTRLGA
jgi:hypothetical protein